jgi:PAS domain S-box-containing protein
MEDEKKTKAQLIEELRAARRQAEILRQIGLEITAQLDLDTLLHSIVVWAVELLGGSAGEILLYDPQKDMLESVASIGGLGELVELYLRRGEGFSGKIWESGRPLITHDYQSCKWRVPPTEAAFFTSAVGAPIYWRDHFLGVLNVANAPQGFSQADAEMLSLVAAQAAAAIHNAQLIRSLRESEARFRQFAEHINDVFWMTNLDGSEMIYINANYEQMWGRSCQSLRERPRSWQDNLHPDDRESLNNLLKTLDDSRPNCLEYRIVRPDGSVRWVQDRSFPVRNEAGEVYRLAGIVTDITERKRVEAEREKLIHELRELLDTIKTLSGIIPICASCKKIRDEAGLWQPVEVYVRNHTDAEFSHSLCSDCARALYPDMFEDNTV